MGGWNPMGYIFNLQRFSLHDGPGIRTTVFLKGCPLRCGWCANPESMRPLPEIITREAKCIGCGRCLSACPQGAIVLQEGRRAIHWEQCDQCRRCAEVCPSGAIEVMGRPVGVAEVLEEVLRDRRFYQRNGGGLTVSGGEPLFQGELARDLLAQARQQGLHTALDTSGYADWGVLERVLEHADLVLYDLKQMDDERHRQGTGVSNRRILENLEQVAYRYHAGNGSTRIWVRCPVIPGFNDSEENFRAMAHFVQSLGEAVERVSLLPYHRFGELKYAAIGKAYPYEGQPMLSEERLEELRGLLESYQLTVTLKK
ncbi:MAG: glycyl-radical enzyme activating protein [Candidatus Tectomicrobia bacterium]|uniref:Glycyl-radical enzyme activating protein n=1 Tax=Tectimicrobiota bacterium TaxID=2528274 RepID=A0A932CM40_UNCTE|nr:glycyl-radical enzyme activating protein [Candidatus Tectomicrobia bacterium]